MSTYYNIKENNTHKLFFSPIYNYAFDKATGYFIRWGRNRDDDPTWSPFGPEILDLEISTGKCLGGCKFCYKCNGNDAFNHNMTLDTFENILIKMPRTLTQIAFGITDIHANPDFFAMLAMARSYGVIPNYTTHGLDVDEETAKITARYCGAVAVSIVSAGKSFRAIELYHEAGCKQINIHFMLSNETYDKAKELIELVSKYHKDQVRAIVYLLYKPKGRTPDAYTSISIEKYNSLIELCEDKSIGYGFDSCSAPMYLKAVDDYNKSMYAEPCESTLFSSYINSDGVFFPCSFCEGTPGWENGISVINSTDFMDVWLDDKVIAWRNKLIASSKNCVCKHSASCRNCPIYDITPCKKVA